MDIIVLILTGGVGAAVIKLIETVMNHFLQRRSKKEDNQTQEDEDIREMIRTLKKAQKIILEDRIRHLSRKYMGDGCVDLDDLSSLLEMHLSYKSLGGNGKLKQYVTEVERLPRKPR